MIFRFLLAAASVLLLTACAKDAAPPQAPEAQIDTTRVELHFHAIAGLNPGTTGQPAPVRVRIFELKTPLPSAVPTISPWQIAPSRPSVWTCWTRMKWWSSPASN